MPPVGVQPTISADERAQTYALDRAATRIASNFWPSKIVTVDYKPTHPHTHTHTHMYIYIYMLLFYLICSKLEKYYLRI
jgi:hypothetical protein